MQTIPRISSSTKAAVLLMATAVRWFDLVRTQTWDKRAAVYHIKGPGKDDIYANVEEVKRGIQKEHYLFPIPQGQLDSMQMSDEEKAAYQNPGYPTE